MEQHTDWPAPTLDTTRPGPPRLIWEARFEWEGQLLLDRISALPGGDGPLSVQAYVSESPELRAMLRGLVTEALRGRGQVGSVQIRSAYKTGYFYFTEEVRPLWRRLQADRLSVTYPVVPGEAAGRFLQELYPLAAVLEREGVAAEFRPGGPQPEYQAVLSRGSADLWHGNCPMPLHPRTSPDGRTVLTPDWLAKHHCLHGQAAGRAPADRRRALLGLVLRGGDAAPAGAGRRAARPADLQKSLAEPAPLRT